MRRPNLHVKLTAERRCRSVPSVLRTPAAGYVRRWATMRFGICLLLWLASSFVRADDFPYVRVSCDAKGLALVVEESSVSSEADIPSGKGIQSLFALMKVKTIDGPAGTQDYLVKKRDFSYDCAMGDARYKVRVSPWKFSAKVNGMCGDYSPSTQLTVLRGEEQLIDKLVFSGYCNSPESDYYIQRIQLSESAKRVVLFLRDRAGPYEREVSFDGLPALKREALVRKPQ